MDQLERKVVRKTDKMKALGPDSTNWRCVIRYFTSGFADSWQKSKHNIRSV